MAAKKKIINIKVYFDGDQDAKEVFAEVIAQKIWIIVDSIARS